MTSTKKDNPDKVGIAKFWAWNSRQVSYGAMVVIVGYITIYCTNTLMMSPALVGTLLLASKVFDGVTDLIAGYVIDNTNTKLGKGRPYELAIIFLWFFTWLMFSCSPEWSTTVKAAWIFIMYSLVNSVFGTLLSSNQTAYMVRAFASKQQIVKLNTLGGIVISLGTTVVAMLFPQAMSSIATSASGWSKMIAMFAVPLTLIGLLRFLVVKETVPIDVKTAQKLDLHEMGLALKTNKYIYVVCILTLVSSITSNINAGAYYFTYIVGDIGKFSILSLIGMPLVLIMFVFPPLLKKFTPTQVITGGAVLGVCGFVINFFAGANMVLLCIGSVLANISYMPICYLIGLLIMDCATYNEWKGLPRMEGTMQSFQSFGTKVGQGLGSAMAGFLLGLVGFDGTAATAAELSSSSLLMIRSLYGLLPAITYTIIAVCAHFYNLEEKMPQIEEELKERKSAAASSNESGSIN